MPKIPGMDGDVYFGATNELPDWRNEPFNEGEDATPEEIAGVERMLGRKLSDIFPDDEESEYVEDDEPEDAEI